MPTILIGLLSTHIRAPWNRSSKNGYTSNCLSLSRRTTCFRWRELYWFWTSESSNTIIDSHSLMTASLNPSCNKRHRSFSVETVNSSAGAKSLLVRTRGKRSLAASSSSIHAPRSSLDSHRKWRVFVPVNIESLLSSDLLARTEDTCIWSQLNIMTCQKGKLTYTSKLWALTYTALQLQNTNMIFMPTNKIYKWMVKGKYKWRDQL